MLRCPSPARIAAVLYEDKRRNSEDSHGDLRVALFFDDYRLKRLRKRGRAFHHCDQERQEVFMPEAVQAPVVDVGGEIVVGTSGHADRPRHAFAETLLVTRAGSNRETIFPTC